MTWNNLCLIKAIFGPEGILNAFPEKEICVDSSFENNFCKQVFIKYKVYFS